MRKQLTVALLCMAVSTPALALPSLDEVFDAREGQVLFDPYKGEEKRLRIEQMRLENERLEQEIQLREREAQRREQERLQLQREARERERAQTGALREQTEGTDQSTGPDMYEQLRTIGQLRDDGILTEEKDSR